jgi:uncharacterized protein YcnI
MRPRVLALLTAALVALPATAALAHPSFNPNAVPVGEPVDTVLVVPHGCSTGSGVMPEEGEAVPTTRFDLQTPDGVTIEPQPVDGWEAEDDGEAIVWTDAGGATTEPIELAMTLTVEDGAAGDELLLSAYQECEDGSSYRWTEGAEGTPPVRLELTEGETGTVEVEDGDHGGTAMDDMTTTDAPTASETIASEETTTEPAAETPSDTATVTADQAAAEDDDGGGTLAAVIAVLVVLIGGGGYAFARARRSA